MIHLTKKSSSLNCIHMAGVWLNQSVSLEEKEAGAKARVWLWQKQKATVNKGSSRSSKNAATWAILLDLDNISLVKEEQRKALKTFTYSGPALAKIWLSTVEHCGSQRAVMRINCCTSYQRQLWSPGSEKFWLACTECDGQKVYQITLQVFFKKPSLSKHFWFSLFRMDMWN